MLGWLLARGASKSRVAQMQARINPELWTQTLASHAFLARLNDDERTALQARVAWFLASKAMTGAGGQVLTDEIRLSIAAQACLPILYLDPGLYEGWTEVIVYPSGFLIPRTDMDEDGIVHEYIEEAAGEAWEGGPVVLSWEDAGPGGERPEGFNVVIHEFAHKLDLQFGQADGMPSLHAHPDITPRLWRRVLEASYESLLQQLETIEAAIPPDVDPESEEADPWYAQLPIDPYAATDTAEFFAVSSEAFFVHPGPLRAAMPEWYGLLVQYYRQDPLGDPGRLGA
ncbi:MAG: zinc-dependent peptidase [Pigmentiphaga sp.]|uniref:M90 family metallopeptidase n=1 Tax=Pigmentiphaga sp. TaxID=1977564 RepID=UPI0029A0CD15|nr:zinc-dependent peptidase [Pigmentiphaga sp.]MDX3905666.1 zinc-dependent peptidase [Pigmentiphaga sp.]